MAEITLRILDGADRGRTYDSLPTPVTIGREEGNSIQLNDERVSRFHLKIQEDGEKIVLTDLESTNGTKVNGEDIQLRILRFGDMISVGRSVLLYGSQVEIAHRLAQLRSDDPDGTGSFSQDDLLDPDAVRPDFDLAFNSDIEVQNTLHTLRPPELPKRLTPGQAAQLAELLEYIHIRIRELLSSVEVKEQGERISLDPTEWQSLLGLQGRLATYLRAIGHPDEND